MAVLGGWSGAILPTHEFSIFPGRTWTTTSTMPNNNRALSFPIIKPHSLYLHSRSTKSWLTLAKRFPFDVMLFLIAMQLSMFEYQMWHSTSLRHHVLHHSNYFLTLLLYSCYVCHMRFIHLFRRLNRAFTEDLLMRNIKLFAK